MIRNLILTKIFFPQARIIRFPFDIRNKKWIKIGKGFTCGVGCRLEAHPDKTKKITSLLIIGDNVQINDYVHIVSKEKVVIGNNVLMASKIFISDLNHGNYSALIHDSPVIPPEKRSLSTAPVIIGENVWLGEFVSILPGVTIGKGTVVGANSVVSKSLPPNVIAVDSPAKPIKKFNFETLKWEKI